MTPLPPRSARCPNSLATGCRCPEHELGLFVHCPPEQQAAYLRVLTGISRMKPPAEGTHDCAGMTCMHIDCVRERTQRVKAGARGEGNASPFKIRRAA